MKERRKEKIRGEERREGEENGEGVREFDEKRYEKIR